MGELKFNKLIESEIRYWLNICKLRNLYNELRFGLEIVDGRNNQNIEKGGIRDFIERVDFKSKSKFEMEMLRRSVREKNRKDVLKYKKLINQNKVSNKLKWENEIRELNEKINYRENIILLKYLNYDILNNYLIKVNFGSGLEVICFYKCKNGMSKDLLEYIAKTFLYSFEYVSFFGVEQIDIYLKKFFRKGLVESKEYKGVVHPFRWYVEKINKGELLVNEIGEYKNKIIENFYPLISVKDYNKLILDFKENQNKNFFGY
jgi:hypothetical protein